MKKILIAVVVISFIISCKERPNYNPFDNLFNISVKHLIADGCDTISAGCGYFNLVQSKSEGIQSYYQVFVEEFDEVIAKGFYLEIDKHPILNWEDFYKSDSIQNTIRRLPIPEYELSVHFSEFGFQIYEMNEDSIFIFNASTKDSIGLEVDVFLNEEKENVIRSVSYFNSRTS